MPGTSVCESRTLDNPSRKYVYLCRSERKHDVRELGIGRSKDPLHADRLAAEGWGFNHLSPSPLPRVLAVHVFTGI